MRYFIHNFSQLQNLYSLILPNWNQPILIDAWSDHCCPVIVVFILFTLNVIADVTGVGLVS